MTSQQNAKSPNRPRRGDRHWLVACVALTVAIAAAYLIFEPLGASDSLELARSQPLRIGFQKSPPYQLVSEDGQRGGVGLEVVTEAANRLGLQLTWVYSPLSPDENFAAGNVDLWPIVTDLPHRRENFYISQPIYENALGLLFLESERIGSIEDASQSRVAYFDREPGITLTSRLLPQAELVGLPSHRDAIRAVFNGECDAAFLWSTKTNSIDFEEAIADHRDKPFRFHYFSDEKITCGIGASYDNPAAIAAANLMREEIRQLVREGFVQEVYFRYFLDPENEISSYFYLDDLQRTSRRQNIAIAVLAAALLVLVGMAIKLRRSRKAAEAANEAKSRFLATMSHEFRTPLNGITGMAQLVELTDLTEEQTQYVSVIKQSADALLTIVNDILDISKIEAGKLELEYAPVNLRELILSITPFFELMALRKGLDFESNIDPNCPETILADAARLRQVLFNLLGNAIKFTVRGKVSIAVTSVRLRDKDRLLFEISDTGIGVPVERHQEIFEAFTQIDGSFSRAFGGTGLGLSISRYLVTLMKGELHLASVPDEGSVFSVSIPLIRSDATSTLEPSQPEKNSSLDFDALSQPPLRTLVVDDNAINLRALQAIMQKLGHSVTTASNGVEAIEAFEPSRFDLVLLDLQMPNLDGWETARLMRQKEAASDRKIPIVAVSAYPRRDANDRKQAANIDGFLAKPIEIRLLVKEIAKALATQTRAAP